MLLQLKYRAGEENGITVADITIQEACIPSINLLVWETRETIPAPAGCAGWTLQSVPVASSIYPSPSTQALAPFSFLQK